LIATEEAASLDLGARKKAGDIGGTQRAAAAQMDFGAVMMHELEKKRKDFIANKDENGNAKYTPEEVAAGLRGLDEEKDYYLEEIQAGIQKHVDETAVEDEDGKKTIRVSPLLRQMTGDAFQIDENGNVTRNDNWDAVSTLKTQGELLGYKYGSEEQEIISDRAGKVMTINMKEELATETEKRKGLESGTNLMSRAPLYNAYQDFLGGRFQSAGMWSMRDSLARFENLLKSATAYIDPNQSQAMAMVWKQVRNINNVDHDAAMSIIKENNTTLAQTLTAALHEKSYQTAMGVEYAKAAKAAGLTGITDEVSFIKAQAAPGNQDLVTQAKLGEVKVQVDQTTNNHLLQSCGLDPRAIGDQLTLKVEKDQYGHSSAVSVGIQGLEEGQDMIDKNTDANGSVNTDALDTDLSKMQALYDHVADAMSSQNIRVGIGKAFSGGMIANMSVYRNQFHSFFEKAMKRALEQVDLASLPEHEIERRAAERQQTTTRAPARQRRRTVRT